MAKSKNGRISQHDEIAVPIVVNFFKSLGFSEHTIGQESDNDIREQLKGKRDPLSLMFRFKPDKLFTHPNHSPIACEIKSESGQHKNFAIEFDSWVAAKAHSDIYKAVVYAFVDLKDSSVKCCWAQDIPRPTFAWVPMRSGYKKVMDDLELNHPTVRFLEDEVKGGSGTPYFLIPKASSYLRSFDDFMAEVGFIKLSQEQELKKDDLPMTKGQPEQLAFL